MPGCFSPITALQPGVHATSWEDETPTAPGNVLALHHCEGRSYAAPFSPPSVVPSVLAVIVALAAVSAVARASAADCAHSDFPQPTQ